MTVSSASMTTRRRFLVGMCSTVATGVYTVPAHALLPMLGSFLLSTVARSIGTSVARSIGTRALAAGVRRMAGATVQQRTDSYLRSVPADIHLRSLAAAGRLGRLLIEDNNVVFSERIPQYNSFANGAEVVVSRFSDGQLMASFISEPGCRTDVAFAHEIQIAALAGAAKLEWNKLGPDAPTMRLYPIALLKSDATRVEYCTMLGQVGLDVMSTRLGRTAVLRVYEDMGRPGGFAPGETIYNTVAEVETPYKVPEDDACECEPRRRKSGRRQRAYRP